MRYERLHAARCYLQAHGRRNCGMGIGLFPPPCWKMWLVSIVAVYPLVLAFQALVVPRMAGLPLPPAALLVPLALLTLMPFVVMPVVTRLLR
jgi:antibiotic biosynthesis monooxygenase (ABM) superfamily enzyme